MLGGTAGDGSHAAGAVEFAANKETGVLLDVGCLAILRERLLDGVLDPMWHLHCTCVLSATTGFGRVPRGIVL